MTLEEIEARNALVVANLGLVHEVVRRHVRLLRAAGADAADAVQVGMLALMRAAERYNPGRGVRFSTFGYFVARRDVLRWAAKESRRRCLPIQDAPDRPAPSEPASGSEASRLRHNLRLLASRHRQVLQLRYEQGLTLEAAGERMGVSKQRAFQIQSQALAALRKLMDVAA